MPERAGHAPRGRAAQHARSRGRSARGPAAPLRCPPVGVHVFLIWTWRAGMAAGAVGERRWAGSQACFGAARHLAVLARERTQAGGLAHQTAVAANWPRVGCATRRET